MSKISVAEMILKVAVGANMSRYVEKDKWDEQNMNNQDYDLQTLDEYLLNNDNKYHNAKTKTIKGNNINLSNKKYKIWNIWIRSSIVDFNSNFMDDILNTTVVMKIGQVVNSEIPMVNNLFLAKLMGREIIEGYDYIDIPIVLTDLFYPDTFPTYCLKFNDISFNLKYQKMDSKKYIIPITQIRFDYEEELNIKMNDIYKYKLNPVLQCTDGRYYNVTLNGNVNNLNLGGVCKMIFFEFVNYEVDKPILDSVSLLIHDKYEIEYSVLNGEVFCFDFFDRQLFALSVTPEFTTEDDMIKFFTSKRSYVQTGINFSRLDNTKIKFNLDQEYPGLKVKISFLECNLFLTGDGMGGLRYLR